MNLGQLSVRQPIFAIVLSIVTVIVGGIAYFTLPVTEYPDVVPPTVVVTTMYPGASAQTVADTMATPIEQEVNGVEDMLYMYSQATSDGGLTLTVTFKPGTNLDKAQVLVPESRRAGRAATPAAGAAERHLGEEVLADHPQRRFPVLSRRKLRSALRLELRAAGRRRRPEAR